MTDPRQIQWVPLDDLTPDPDNPKAHAEDTIAASVNRHGMIDLITRDDRTGYIISGHGRTKTLRTRRDEGQPAPDGVRVHTDGTWLVPVITGWSSTDDLDARAALIGLNQTTILGGWVDDTLLTLLDELRDAEAPAVGFTDGDLEILRRKIEAEGVFTHGPGDMLDEFRGISGQDEAEYNKEYAHKVTVFLRDAEAVEDFRQRLGLDGDLGRDLNYPLGWVPQDARRYPTQGDQ